MARPPAYYLYSGELKTMQAGSDLDALIKMAKRHGELFGGSYKVKDSYGNVVWEEDEK